MYVEKDQIKRDYICSLMGPPVNTDQTTVHQYTRKEDENWDTKHDKRYGSISSVTSSAHNWSQ